MEGIRILILFENDSHLETDHPAIAHNVRFHFQFVIHWHDRFKRFGGYENLLPATGTNDRYVQHGLGGAGVEQCLGGEGRYPCPISAVEPLFRPGPMGWDALSILA